MLALNRGRPHLADSLMRLRHEIDTSPYFFRAVTTWAVLYGEGDRADADTTERARAEFLARDTLTEPSHRPDSTADQASREHYQDVLDGVNQEALWRWAHASPKTAVDLARWMRRHDDANRADIVDMLLASDAGSPDAPSLRTRVAGAALDGCCNGNHHVYLLLATAYERAGQYAEALQAVRRGQWRLPTMFLAAYLGMEGRLAERVGDHAGAIRAYEHYLALRSDPEPGHRAGRDSVRAELSRIERATTTATHQP
jgi:tetratricopeptide (TPR) repeat protein